MEATDSITLMTPSRIQRSLHRMAHEINEVNKADKSILLIGIDQRGLVVANALEHILSGVSDKEVEAHPLKTGKEASNQQLDIAAKDANNLIIIVDDVIFSGRTMFHALRVTANKLDPSEIHSAVLIDRGHRKFPINAEFCGLQLPTKLDEHVSVIIKKDKITKVELVHKEL